MFDSSSDFLKLHSVWDLGLGSVVVFGCAEMEGARSGLQTKKLLQLENPLALRFSLFCIRLYGLHFLCELILPAYFLGDDKGMYPSMGIILSQDLSLSLGLGLIWNVD